MRQSPPVVAFGFNLDSDYQDLGEMMLSLASRYGDCVRVSRLQKWYFINHPDYIRQVLLDNQSNYTKDNAGFRRISAIFGRGLLTVSDSDSWQKQHDLIKKDFQLKNLRRLADITAKQTVALCADFKKLQATEQVFNLSSTLMRLVLTSTSEALFSYQFDEQTAQQVIDDLAICNRYVSFGLSPNFFIPTPGNISFHLAKRRLQAIVRDIAEQGSEKDDNLLGTLLSAYRAGDITQQILFDQVFTFMVTGHETTGSLLSWLFLCLDQNPHISESLRAQLRMQCHSGPPSFETCEQLIDLKKVIDETLRLYPSIWHIVRRASLGDTIGPYAIPAGASIIISQYALHRHPAFWEDPERFDPERFDKSHSIARLSYLPFGFGPRMCIASQLALLQTKIIAATIHQQVRFKLFSPEAVKKEFLISMRPRDGLRALALNVA